MKKIILMAFSLIILGVGCNSQDTIIENQQKKIDELSKNVENLIKQNTETQIPYQSTINDNKNNVKQFDNIEKTTAASDKLLLVDSPENTQAKNFYNELLSLYATKNKILQRKIVMLGVLKGIHEGNAADEINSISVATKIQNDSGYDTSYGVTIWKLELEEDNKLIVIYNKTIADLKIMQARVQDKMTSLNNNIVYVSEEEYLLQENILNTNINDNYIDTVDKYIEQNRFFTAEKRDELHSKILLAAQKDLETINQQLAALKIEKNNSPILTAPTFNISSSIVPTNINCETSNTKSGTRTVCVESPTMKSFTCETTRNVAGKELKSCYYR